MNAMQTWNFQLRLNRAPTDDEVDALYEAGLDDAAVETEPLGLVDLDREATTLLAAITSAIRQIESVPGLRVVGLGDSGVVTLREIADRLGRTYEAVRLYSEGRRGPGGFPSPLLGVTGLKDARTLLVAGGRRVDGQPPRAGCRAAGPVAARDRACAGAPGGTVRGWGGSCGAIA